MKIHKRNLSQSWVTFCGKYYSKDVRIAKLNSEVTCAICIKRARIDAFLAAHEKAGR